MITVRRAARIACLFLTLAAARELAAPAAATAQQRPTDRACVACHQGLDDERLAAPALRFPEDIHAEAGFGCLDCHGDTHGGGRDRNTGFLSAPTRRNIPALCGRCHSDAVFMRGYDPSLRVDQVAEYWTSVHGRLLREENAPDVATCVDCHPAHEIRPPSDPSSSVYPTNVAATCGHCHGDPEVMAGRDIPTNQPEQYLGSVHGKLMEEEGDLSAPTCNDCHGNHGAAPPGVSSVRNVCGQCHAMMDRMFGESGHAERFTRGGRAGCATCHGHHAIVPASDTLLVARTRDVCSTCHDEQDPDGRAFLRMKALLDSLQAEAARGRSLLLEAENAGMEVSQALFELDDVGNALTKARTAIHTLHVDSVRGETRAGFDVADRAIQRGNEALAEHRFRRVGLGFSAGIILILVLGLALKIRQIEARNAGARSRPTHRGDAHA